MFWGKLTMSNLKTISSKMNSNTKKIAKEIAIHWTFCIGVSILTTAVTTYFVAQIEFSSRSILSMLITGFFCFIMCYSFIHITFAKLVMYQLRCELNNTDSPDYAEMAEEYHEFCMEYKRFTNELRLMREALDEKTGEQSESSTG